VCVAARPGSAGSRKAPLVSVAEALGAAGAIAGASGTSVPSFRLLYQLSLIALRAGVGLLRDRGCARRAPAARVEALRSSRNVGGVACTGRGAMAGVANFRARPCPHFRLRYQLPSSPCGREWGSREIMAVPCARHAPAVRVAARLGLQLGVWEGSRPDRSPNGRPRVQLMVSQLVERSSSPNYILAPRFI